MKCFFCPKRARSRKALATLSRIAAISRFLEVRKGLEAERLWRLAPGGSNKSPCSRVRKGLEAERLWRQTSEVTCFNSMSGSPKRARSRKALATAVSILKRRKEQKSPKRARSRKALATRDFLVVNGLDRVGPKRARSRKALATHQGAPQVFHCMKLSEKGSKPKGFGDYFSPGPYSVRDMRSEKGSKPKGFGDSKTPSTFAAPGGVRKGLDAERLMFSENKRCIYCNP